MITVLTTGCFDIVHLGHLRCLREARALGDRLVVGLTGDRQVRKGPGRPVFDENQRAEMLLEWRCVDDVVIYHEPVPLELIRKIRPDVYVKGRDYEGRLPEQALVEELGGRVVFTDTVIYSSSQLLGWLP